MKYIIYVLSICALIGTYYNIVPGITYADIFCSILLMISLYKYYLGSWKIDRFCRLTALYIPFMLLASTLNFELDNTIFLNYFRNYSWGVIVYFALSNSINSIKDIKKLLFIGIPFLILFIVNYKGMMQETFSENLATLDFGYGRNNVAFTALLFSILFEFLYYSKILNSFILLGIVIMTTIIIFCTSRFAIIMLIANFILFKFYSYKKFTTSEIYALIILILIGPIIYNYIISSIDSEFFEYSHNYLNEKINGAGDDFLNSRIISINIKPILYHLNNDGFIFLLLGNPSAIQHSFFSHTLITTGICGCICYLVTNIKLLRKSFKFKNNYFFLFLLILTMFINDFTTNARFIVGINSLFYSLLCAIMYKYIIINENTHFSK